MKPTQYFKPISVTVSRFPLKKHHIVFVHNVTPTHTRLSHIVTTPHYLNLKSITHAQFKTGYRPLTESEVLQFVEE